MKRTKINQKWPRLVHKKKVIKVIYLMAIIDVINFCLQVRISLVRLGAAKQDTNLCCTNDCNLSLWKGASVTRWLDYFFNILMIKMKICNFGKMFANIVGIFCFPLALDPSSSKLGSNYLHKGSESWSSGDSGSRGCEFESQHRILDENFFTLIWCKICLFWKDQKNEKEAGIGPLKKYLPT